MRDIDVEAEYLHPADAQILDLYEDDGDLWIEFAVPETDGDATYKLEARVERATETDLELPLDDVEEAYD